MRFSGTSNEAVWLSEVMDVADLGSFDLSMDIQGNGGLDPDDYLRVSYILDGGNEVVVAERFDDFNGNNVETITAAGLSGGTVQIIVRAQQSSSSENHYLDNVTLSLFGVIANTAPQFTSTAVTVANENMAYSYAVSTSDAEGDSLSLSADTLPSWLTLIDNGDGTGLLSGTPLAANIGDHVVSLRVSDGSLIDTQNFTLTVAPVGVNSAPVFTSNPSRSAEVGAVFSYAIATNDVDGDTLAITAASLPAWLNLVDYGDRTGLLTGTPSASDLGDHAVTVSVSDGELSTDQVFTITVAILRRQRLQLR